jgi:hypothetical protein
MTGLITGSNMILDFWNESSLRGEISNPVAAFGWRILKSISESSFPLKVPAQKAHRSLAVR